MRGLRAFGFADSTSLCGAREATSQPVATILAWSSPFGSFRFATGCHRLRPLGSINTDPRGAIPWSRTVLPRRVLPFRGLALACRGGVDQVARKSCSAQVVRSLKRSYPSGRLGSDAGGYVTAVIYPGLDGFVIAVDDSRRNDVRELLEEHLRFGSGARGERPARRRDRWRVRGVRRTTLTYPELQLARDLLWVVTGEETVGALRKLLAGDRQNPASRVEPGGDSLLLADRAGAPDA